MFLIQPELLFFSVTCARDTGFREQKTQSVDCKCPCRLSSLVFNGF